MKLGESVGTQGEFLDGFEKGGVIESGLKEPLGYVISRLSEPVDAPARKSTIRPRLHFKNPDFTSRTIMEVMASDRLGLLYDILQALTTLRLQITQAIIDTDGEVANDQILFTDEHGQQVLDNFQLGQIRNAVIQAIE